MTHSMPRRTVVLGGMALGLLAAAGVGYAAYRLSPSARSPEAEAEEYAKLLAEVRDDYVNGRVLEHAGWVLSQHEFDTIGTRMREEREDDAVNRSADSPAG